MADTKSITVLVPAKLHAHAVAELEKSFTVVKIEKADPTLVTQELRDKVRGVAAGTAISAGFIDALPNLEIIASFGVGYDAVDARHAGKSGVMVTNTPDVLSDEVADTAIGLLLNTLREFYGAEKWLRDGRWEKEGPYPLTNLTLRGRTVGIFGMGRIGKAIAHRLEAFGVSIHYHNRSKAEGVSYTYHSTLKGMAEAVDTIVSVAPGTPSTEKAVNAEVLKALGPNGVFVNIGRGSTVDQPALIAALKNRIIAAAGLDVFADEPHVPAELIALPNASLLPHVGSASEHTRKAMAQLVADNIASWFVNGKAVTPVPETIHVTSESV